MSRIQWIQYETFQGVGPCFESQNKIVYLPLIDRPPAHSATMMMALLKAQEVSSIAGQKFVIFTADQQLYRVALHVIWENQAKFT